LGALPAPLRPAKPAGASPHRALPARLSFIGVDAVGGKLGWTITARFAVSTTNRRSVSWTRHI